MDLGDLFGKFDADQISDLIELVTKNKGALQVLGELPDYFEKIAAALGGAGEQAKAAVFESAARVPTMDGPVSRLAGAAKEMGTTTERLADLGDAMGAIGDTLAKVGAALAKLGEHLGESGTQARNFAELG